LPCVVAAGLWLASCSLTVALALCLRDTTPIARQVVMDSVEDHLQIVAQECYDAGFRAGFAAAGGVINEGDAILEDSDPRLMGGQP